MSFKIFPIILVGSALLAGCGQMGSRPTVDITSLNGTTLADGGNGVSFAIVTDGLTCTANMTASASDAEDGMIADDQIVWRAAATTNGVSPVFEEFDIGRQAQLNGPCGDFETIERGATRIYSLRTVIVTATDNDGNANVDSLKIRFRLDG